MDRGSILVVDDEPNARAALDELLRYEGYRVETATGGRDALGKIEHSPPDIVLTDLRMPDIGGLELLERVRERHADVTVVVMSAFTAGTTQADVRRKGAAACLSKPLDLDELVLCLGRELERSRLRREADNRCAGLGEVDSATASTPVGEPSDTAGS